MTLVTLADKLGVLHLIQLIVFTDLMLHRQFLSSIPRLSLDKFEPFLSASFNALIQVGIVSTLLQIFLGLGVRLMLMLKIVVN